MTMNEEMNRMHAQILNLRSAGITLGTAIHNFPPCGRPGSCNRKCPEAGAALQEIYESMNDLMLSVRVAYAAVINRYPKQWDFLWRLAEESTCIERDMAEFAQELYPDQGELIRLCAEADNKKMEELGTAFSKGEWAILTAKRAWQNGRRLPQVFRLLKYLEDQISKQCDLYESVIYSGMLGDCNLGQWAKKKEAARA